MERRACKEGEGENGVREERFKEEHQGKYIVKDRKGQ